MAIDPDSGLVTWTPLNEHVGDNPVVVRVTDSYFASATQSFSVTVANVNDKPLITSSPITVAAVDVPYSYTVEVLDPDVGDTMTFSLVEDFPSGMSIDTNGVITWTPSSSQAGSHPVTVQVEDGSGAQATQSFSIDVSDVTNVTTVYVADLDATTTSQGRTWTAIVTIEVRDTLGQLVTSATVTGHWSGGASGIAVATPDGSGRFTAQLANIPKKVGVVSFTVGSIEGTDLTYDAELNGDPDSDSDGTSININKPLHVVSAAGGAAQSGVLLTDRAIQPVVDLAISQWAAAGMAPCQLALLRSATVEIADLDGTLLGMAYSDWIVLDRDAAGYGWSPFHSSSSLGAAAGVDLLAAIMHEMGHLVGYEHSQDSSDVMAASLSFAAPRQSVGRGWAGDLGRLASVRSDHALHCTIVVRDLLTATSIVGPSAALQQDRAPLLPPDQTTRTQSSSSAMRRAVEVRASDKLIREETEWLEAGAVGLAGHGTR